MLIGTHPVTPTLKKKIPLSGLEYIDWIMIYREKTSLYSRHLAGYKNSPKSVFRGRLFFFSVCTSVFHDTYTGLSGKCIRFKVETSPSYSKPKITREGLMIWQKQSYYGFQMWFFVTTLRLVSTENRIKEKQV